MKYILTICLLYPLCIFLFTGSAKCQVVEEFSTDLPLIIIDTEGKTIVDEPKITAKMKIVSNENGINHPNDAANDFEGLVGIEIRGSSSKHYPQRPYLFETRDVNGLNLNVSLLGLPEENDWILLSNFNDKSFMRNILGFELFKRLGHYAPRAKLVDVIINNEYQGIYVLTEKIKQDKNRVDIAKLTEYDNTGEEVSGGYIFKIDYWNKMDSWESPYAPFEHPDFKVHFVYHDPDREELTAQQKFYLKNYVTTFESALHGPNFKDPNEGYPNYIDVESFIDYFIISEISRNNDGFKKSRYFHKDKNGKITAGPVWDFDWAWKNIDQCFIFKATDGSGWSYKINDCNPWVKSPGWMIQLFEDFNFKRQTNCRYFDLRDHELSDENILGMVDSLYNVVKNAQIKHFEKYQILGKNVGAPEVDEQPETFEGEVEKLKDWIQIRLSWLDENMPGTCSGEAPAELTENQTFLVYPNPVSAKINIISKQLITEVQMIDFTGRILIVDHSLFKKWIKININDVPPGIYLLRIKDISGNTSTEKIIVQREK